MAVYCYGLSNLNWASIKHLFKSVHVVESDISKLIIFENLARLIGIKYDIYIPYLSK